MAMFLMEVDLDLDLLCEADCDLVIRLVCPGLLLCEQLLLLHWLGVWLYERLLLCQ